MTPAPTPHSPRVLHVITHFALGGAERVAVSLASELHDRFTFGFHAVQNVGSHPVGKTLQDALNAYAIPQHLGTRVPTKLGGMLTGGLALARTIRRFQPDIIHLHTEIPESAYAVAITACPARRTIPLVRTIHNSRFWHHWQSIGRWAERRMPPAHIAAVSHDALCAYEAHSSHAKRAPLSHRIIFNGVPAPAALPHRPRDPNAPVRLLFAGRFEPQKGADLLPEIVSRLTAADGPACELTIAGEGDLAPLLRQLPPHAPRNWQINIVAPIPDLPTHLHEFDILLMPSRFEGLSLLAIEAVMRKIPVIATRAPGLRETFPADYPWLAESGDAADFARVLTLALRSPATWTEATERAQSFALSNFSLPRMAADYAALYEHITRSRPTRRAQ